jgi:hypothetical protein
MFRRTSAIVPFAPWRSLVILYVRRSIVLSYRRRLPVTTIWVWGGGLVAGGTALGACPIAAEVVSPAVAADTSKAILWAIITGTPLLGAARCLRDSNTRLQSQFRRTALAFDQGWQSLVRQPGSN